MAQGTIKQCAKAKAPKTTHSKKQAAKVGKRGTKPSLDRVHKKFTSGLTAKTEALLVRNILPRQQDSRHGLSGSTAVRTPRCLSLRLVLVTVLFGAISSCRGLRVFPRRPEQDDDADAPSSTGASSPGKRLVGGLAQVECQPARVLEADVSRERNGDGGTGGEVCGVGVEEDG
ncbi:hypothetical protein C2857_002305 [Epichloe festucae Fl1]|uniref:Uncharacterized protein n=1 Tax=Epichloe festucae (strain Fl1) TaxID=877507 RepID=A0A7S9KUI1_EPIFF|nr:hypothetical protein C2857_002305 [Epichloe festucae Fl1]